MVARKREDDLAKVDYLVYGYLACAASNKKEFESRMDVVLKLRTACKEVLTGDIYNPLILMRRELNYKKQQNQDLDLLHKVAALSE